MRPEANPVVMHAIASRVFRTRALHSTRQRVASARQALQALYLSPCRHTHDDLGPSEGTLSLMNDLKQPLHNHCGRSNLEVADNLHKCPFLESNPILKRTATRESNARTYVRKFPMVIQSATGSSLMRLSSHILV